LILAISSALFDGVELGRPVRLLERLKGDERDRRVERDDRVDGLVLGQ
jgi:hypothetical protein